MIDFTMDAYRDYIAAIKSSFSDILSFDYLIQSSSWPNSFCVLRHDVDRKPYNALNMARLENQMGIHATYYFRTKPETFKPKIIRHIHRLGHEIGYHYESLSDARGNNEAALKDFALNLERLRSLVPVRTISMHGRPLSAQNNIDLWRLKENHRLLIEQFNLLGEIYLDIDYTDVVYISDTGRNWNSTQSNIRDHVNSKLLHDFQNGRHLLDFLKCSTNNRQMIFMTHPERWSKHSLEYMLQILMDSTTNFIKRFLR